MKNYVGTYRVFSPIDKNGNITPNKDDTYLKGKYGTEVYRYTDNVLALYFKSKNSVKNVIDQMELNNISLQKFLDGCNESVYLFDEANISKVNDIIKFKAQGKGISPYSIRTVRKVRKMSAKKR